LHTHVRDKFSFCDRSESEQLFKILAPKGKKVFQKQKKILSSFIREIMEMNSGLPDGLFSTQKFQFG
jgi:hypothetical protein